MVPKHFPTVVFAARNLERAVTCLGLRANEQQYRLRRKSDTIVSPEQPYTTSEVQSLWPWWKQAVAGLLNYIIYFLQPYLPSFFSQES